MRRSIAIRYLAIAVASMLVLVACAAASDDSGDADGTSGTQVEQIGEDEETSASQPTENEPTHDTDAAGGEDVTDEPRDSGSLETVPGAVTPVDPKHTDAVSPGMEQLVAVAAADLASRLGIAESDIDVTSAQPVVWPDGSLGCPQPGMAYTQVQVEGSQITLNANGAVWSYHGGDDGVPVLCETKK